MNHSASSKVHDLDALLQRMRDASASASLRPEGGSRMLGDLVVCGLEKGVAIHLSGTKRRDNIPPKGAPVSLTVILEEEVHSMRTRFLDPILSAEGDTSFPPVLRVAWPTQSVLSQRRKDVRVATPDLPPLQATLVAAGNRIDAKLLNLTETGVGLGLKEAVPLRIHSSVVIETELPGGRAFRSSGEVRHVDCLVENAVPHRIGLVLEACSPEDREALHVFVQARRTDRSETLRQALAAKNGRK